MRSSPRYGKSPIPTKEAPALRWKDYVSLFISVAAFVVSLLTSYYTLFRDAPSLTLSLIAFDRSHDYVSLVVAAGNSGNRSAVLVDAPAIFYVELDGTLLSTTRLGTTASSTPIPTLLEPGRLSQYA